MQNKKKTKSDGKKEILFFSIALGVVLLDQILKKVAQTHFKIPLILIKHFLNLSYIENTGAGFGILAGSTIVLAWFSVMVIGIILFFHDKIEDGLMNISFALITGGALGNMLDRFLLGYVIDFIDFSFFPAFNIADANISIGGAILLIYLWKNPKN